MKLFVTKQAIINQRFTLVLLSVCFILTLFYTENLMAQQRKQMVRLAKIEVYPINLNSYNATLKEQMAAAIKLEPGVLTYYAVSDKTNPSHITILEIYADTNAYKKHITTPHFKKYKATVATMVKSLELVDVDLLGYALKSNR